MVHVPNFLPPVIELVTVKMNWLAISTKNDAFYKNPCLSPHKKRRRAYRTAARLPRALQIPAVPDLECGDKSRATRGPRHRSSRSIAPQKAASRGVPLAARTPDPRKEFRFHRTNCWTLQESFASII